MLFCCGKIYYDLAARREETQSPPIAIHRIERLYPFPAEEIGRLLARHEATQDIVWVQEEPANMGAWSSVAEVMTEFLRAGQSLRYVGRARAASPATGSARRHAAEQEAIIAAALAPAAIEPADGIRAVTPGRVQCPP